MSSLLGYDNSPPGSPLAAKRAVGSRRSARHLSSTPKRLKEDSGSDDDSPHLLEHEEPGSGAGMQAQSRSTAGRHLAPPAVDGEAVQLPRLQALAPVGAAVQAGDDDGVFCSVCGDGDAAEKCGQLLWRVLPALYSARMQGGP